MRRTVIAALTAVVSAAAPSIALAAPAAPIDFEQRVPVAAAAPGASAAAAAHRDEIATPAIAAPRPFDLLGLRWKGGEHAHVEARVRRADGRWSAWAELPHAEDVSAGPRRGESATGPLWTGRAVAYQLRGEALPAGTRAHFVTVPRSAAPPVTARASADRPAIVPRSQWDPTNSCRPRTTPGYGRIDFSVVHHTESLGGYGRSQSAAMVLGICRFHRNGNGWNDIGYNLLVDRFGVVFEGREGGVDQPVIGAHAGGWNSLSTGVAVIGSHTSVRPSAAAQRSLERVLAWKLSLAGVPATGTITETSPGGDENRWGTGTRVSYQRVVGHRDADHTTCPGPAFYRLLPGIRTRVDAQHEIPEDLLTNSPVGGVLGQGGPAYLTGRLAFAGGRRPRGAEITLQRREDGGAWTDLETVATGVDGIWRSEQEVTVNGTFRAVAEARGVASPAIDVAVAAGVTTQVAPQLVRPGREVTVSGETTPAKPRVTVVVERRASRRAAWRRVRRLALATVDGAYETSLALADTGEYRFLTTTAADDQNAAGAAPVRTAAVRRAGR